MHSGRFYQVGSTAATVIIVVVAVGVFFVAGAAQERLEPIKWSIKTTGKAGDSVGMLKPGARMSVELTAKIEEGWHLYAPDQPPGGPIPTRIEMPEGQPFKLAGEIETPPPRIELDPNFNLETQFYEDEATFTLPVEIAADAPSGKQEVKVNIVFQTCNGQKCLPPKRLKLAVMVEIDSSR